jgi:queuine/archaeosine tRNA-ribosyltransferase
MLDAFTPCLGTDRPKHLLGIGDAESIQAALPMGFDSFGRFSTSLLHVRGLEVNPESCPYPLLQIRAILLD